MQNNPPYSPYFNEIYYSESCLIENDPFFWTRLDHFEEPILARNSSFECQLNFLNFDQAHGTGLLEADCTPIDSKVAGENLSQTGTQDKSKHYDQEVQKIDEDIEELKNIIDAKNTD